MNVQFLCESLRRGNYLGEVGVNERQIKLIFKETRCEYVDWIQLANLWIS